MWSRHRKTRRDSSSGSPARLARRERTSTGSAHSPVRAAASFTARGPPGHRGVVAGTGRQHRAGPSGGIWCGHDRGVGGWSTSPASPEDLYRRSHRCSFCRVTPYRRATSITGAPSTRTSGTAACRCSITPNTTSTTGSLDLDEIEQAEPNRPELSHRNRSHRRTGPGSGPQPVTQEPHPTCQL